MVDRRTTSRLGYPNNHCWNTSLLELKWTLSEGTWERRWDAKHYNIIMIIGLIDNIIGWFVGVFFRYPLDGNLLDYSILKTLFIGKFCW